MAEQWSLLALLAAVAAGLVTATIASLLVLSRQTAFFRYFLIQVLLFNLLILGGLTIRYFELQVQDGRIHPPSALLPSLLAILAPLKIGWLYAFAGMSLLLPGQELPSWFRRRFGAGLAGLFVGWAFLLVAALATGSKPAVDRLLAGLEIVVLGGAASACLYLIIVAGRTPSGPRSRSVALLAGVYLMTFAIMVGSLALGWSRPSGPTRNQLLFNSAFMVIYNLLPLVWIFRVQPIRPIRDSAELDRFGITAREREIIHLICAGRTNQEIADQLFISLATVKDHNYNIFRKTGVRNRVELANLIRGGIAPSPQDTSGMA